MHRIVAMDGDRFVIQGDNNDWLDEDHPSQDQVLGTLFLRDPARRKALGGAALARRPRRAAAVGTRRCSGARAAARAAGTAPAPRPPLRRRSVPRRPPPAPIRAYARQVALVSGAVALVAGVGGGVLLALPSTQTDATTLQVTQQGQFSYAGTAEAGTTYPDGTVSTGDTVWTKLATDLTVSFTNTVTGPDLADLQRRHAARRRRSPRRTAGAPT